MVAAVPIAWFFEIHQRGDKGAMTESLTWLYRTCRAKGIDAATFTMFDKDWSEFNALAAVSKEMLNSPEAAGMYTNVISRLQGIVDSADARFLSDDCKAAARDLFSTDFTPSVLGNSSSHSNTCSARSPAVSSRSVVEET